MRIDYCIRIILRGNISSLSIYVDFEANMEVIDSIREQVEGNSVILYMKG